MPVICLVGKFGAEGRAWPLSHVSMHKTALGWRDPSASAGVSDACEEGFSSRKSLEKATISWVLLGVGLDVAVQVIIAGPRRAKLGERK